MLCIFKRIIRVTCRVRLLSMIQTPPRVTHRQRAGSTNNTYPNLLFYRRKEEDYLKATDFLQPRFVITRTNLLSGVQNNRVTQQIIVVTPAIIKHERYLVTTLLE